MPDTIEVSIVPPKERALFLRYVVLWNFGVEILVGCLARLECSGETNAHLPVDVVIAGHDKKTRPLEPGGIQQRVEERCRRFVLVRLPGIGHVTRGKYHVRLATTLAEALDGPQQGTEDDISIVRVSAPEMEI
jgi:hypothetical protein